MACRNITCKHCKHHVVCVGPRGATGVTGVTGPIGPSGVTGLDGPTGPTGPSGVTGLDGPTGPTGPSGVTGLDGATGPTGPSGVAGLDGATGPTGPSGVAGLVGSTGLTGSTGPAGATGANLFDQSLNTFNAVQFLSVNTPTLTAPTTNVQGTLRVSNAFNMPTGTGANTQVLTSNGAGGTAWQPMLGASPGIFSQYGTATVNTLGEFTLLNTLQSIGNLTLAPNSVLAGYSFQFVAGGVFRNNATARTLTLRLKFNTSTYLTRAFTTAATTVGTDFAWNIQCALTFNGTNMITNFTFRYNLTGVTIAGTIFQTSTLFNSAIANTLDLTAQWTTAAGVGNTITSNYAVFSKLY